jgi:(2Fe-2S) ferredoxin
MSPHGTIEAMARVREITDRDELQRLAPVTKAPIKRHVFVCNGKSCAAVGSAEVKAEFERILESKGLRQGKESKGRNPRGEVVLTDCGSVGFCSIGVAVLVYPEGVWYAQVTTDDVAEIIEHHIEKGEIVRRLALIGSRPRTADAESE